ncbi:MAG TPA: HAD family hydrolase [Gammaproteobacteria bacterium]|nr:HAD family hydrolase [Gammaproteobacteria bacterium]
MTSAFAGIRLVAFDLDGTLVDSVGDLCHCLGEALESAGLPRPSEAQTRSWIGGGVELLIRRALQWALGKPGDSIFDSVFAAFTACYHKNLFVRSRLYPEVPETLAALRGRGLRLCCITNKQADFAKGVLEQAGISGCFELVLGGDSLPEKKPSALPLESAARSLGTPSSAAVFVGDSERDFEAAQAAGWPFVWLTYGYPGEWAPPQNEAVAVLDRFADLLPLLSA